jgi:curli production assembly/transport component CsgG
LKFKRLLEMEACYTYNEPVQRCARDAIETVVKRLVISGIEADLKSVLAPLNSKLVAAMVFEV